jgi:leader peptidase (prepilin peptidase) / N-methyltransferase
MRPLLIVLLVAGGLVLGPFLRALVVRLAVPSGEPWRRSCPACDVPLWPVRSAVPVLAVTGKCPSCRAQVGPPPLSVEVTAAVTLGLLAARIHPGLVLAAVCWLAACTIPLAYVDAATRRLPDLLTAPAFAGTAALLLIAAVAGSHWPALGRCLLGAVVYTVFCLVLFVISPSGMGPGDIKLAASLGTALAWLGWTALFAGIIAGFLLAAAYGTILLILKRANRKTQIPFGPFMIVGTFLVVLAGSWG